MYGITAIQETYLPVRNVANMRMREIPWITDPSFDFLSESISSGKIKNILEFGMGSSTIWFAKQKVNIISVEHNKKYYSLVINSINSINGDMRNMKCILKSLPYEDAFLEHRSEDFYFDLVLVDGRRRVTCVEASIPFIRQGGYLMLDNDERSRYKEIHNILSEWDKQVYEQIGVDYTGWQHKHPEKKWLTTVWQKPSP